VQSLLVYRIVLSPGLSAPLFSSTIALPFQQ